MSSAGAVSAKHIGDKDSASLVGSKHAAARHTHNIHTQMGSREMLSLLPIALIYNYLRYQLQGNIMFT